MGRGAVPAFRVERLASFLVCEKTTTCLFIFLTLNKASGKISHNQKAGMAPAFQLTAPRGIETEITTMKIKATSTNPETITTLTDKFWQALCACQLVPGSGEGELTEEPYGSEKLTFSLEGEDADTPSWSVYGCSCRGNRFRVTCDNTRTVVPIITVTADTRRHALRDSGNMAGWVFRQMLCLDVTRPTGHMISYDPQVEGMETVVLPMEDVLAALTVTEYDSWRRDAEWWDCGLDPQPTSGPGWQVVAA